VGGWTKVKILISRLCSELLTLCVIFPSSGPFSAQILVFFEEEKNSKICTEKVPKNGKK